VEHDYEGDTSFPKWDESKWHLVDSEAYPCGEKYPYPFAFERYERKK
jgi:dihydrofolate reductase